MAWKNILLIRLPSNNSQKFSPSCPTEQFDESRAIEDDQA